MTEPPGAVSVVSPSGPVLPGLLERGVGLLRSWALDVRVGRHAGERGAQGLGYLAGDDAARAADLTAAWCDPAVKTVLCARGGYGAQRLLPLLDWEALHVAGPKTIVGSSDVTALLSAFGARLGAVTVMGPMPATTVVAGADPCPVTVAALHDYLVEGTLPVLDGGRPLRDGCAEGVLVGGNLTLLAAAAGTPYQLEPPPGAIAVLEEIGEEPYRIDRHLTQLLLSGWFDGVAGVALGSWEQCGNDTEVIAVLTDRLGGLGIPVVAGFRFGHGRPQLLVQLGHRARLDSATGTLSPMVDAHGSVGK